MSFVVYFNKTIWGTKEKKQEEYMSELGHALIVIS